jgi:hypothetical protein
MAEKQNHGSPLYRALQAAERLACAENPTLVPKIRELLDSYKIQARAVATSAKRKLSEASLNEFRKHALAHPWIARSGIRPSTHIQTVFKKWLGKGLSRQHIVKVQPKLAGAYATEVSRDPNKRVKSLLVHTHRLPPGTLRPLSMRTVAELSEEELKEKRTHAAAKQARWRQKKRARENQGPSG